MITHILRFTIIFICLIGIMAWFAWGWQKKSRKLLIITPISALLHALIISLSVYLSNALGFGFTPAFLNTWSQVVRIHSVIAISAGALTMLAVSKYGNHST